MSLAGFIILSACGEAECPTGPQVDLTYLSKYWDARSPLNEVEGRRCVAFNIENTGVQICEYSDRDALDAALKRGAQHPAGTALTLEGLDPGVRQAQDKLSVLARRCALSGNGS